MDSVTTICALGDNYIYLYKCGQNNTFVVDPGDSSAVLSVLEERDLVLAAVLATHHHFDHTGGIRELKKKTGCEVIGLDRNTIPVTNRFVKGKDALEVCATRIQVITTPGHTRDSVCYYLQPSRDNQSGMLFTGDTLFIGGCGRPIECDAQTMWNSLRKIAGLPDDTLVYPGHDYTEENYEFALTIEPNNTTTKKRLQEIKERQNQGRLTVPSTVAQEKTTNIFLRADTPAIKIAINAPNAVGAEVFAELRRRKNVFG
ncbi:MAG: hydroxyacylglutathione hydrolase [Planctomycetota bacterium]|nr:MAG: hydroxyacylglutathione hydrolase [Planctomycetota bacterium]